jgi:hypothetical protein
MMVMPRDEGRHEVAQGEADREGQGAADHGEGCGVEPMLRLSTAPSVAM